MISLHQKQWINIYWQWQSIQQRTQRDRGLLSRKSNCRQQSSIILPP
ncbi:MAG: hypothetical protein KME13_14735 [Myxacorys californica WJT36-NPBG1]|nr:hypothetical protein [Myxacorys californica WJT36-NPBG1]